MAEVATNLLGRHVTWSGNRGPCGGAVVAVTYVEGGFLLLVATNEGMVTKYAGGVMVS